MNAVKSELICIAAKSSQYPPEDMAEIAFVGRSNVGKSSLINLLLNRKNLARVSQNPGKTRTINFYGVDDLFRIVDLPGYGYAKVSKSITQDWGKMIEGYLKNRPNLVRVVQLVDSRHEPSNQDVQMYEWLKHYGMDGVVVATKSDKISKNEWQKNQKMIRDKLEMEKTDQLLPISALKKTGCDELWCAMKELIAQWQDG